METQSQNNSIGSPLDTPMPNFTDDLRSMQGRSAAGEAPAANDVATADAAPAVQKPIYVAGNTEFKTAEELAAYTFELEKKNLELQRAQLQYSQQAQPVQSQAAAQLQPVEVEPAIDELLFQDTKKALSMLEEKIEKRIETKYRQEQTQRSAETEFRSSFYNENPDLLPFEKTVQSIVRDHWNELSALKPDQQKKEIALKSRELLDTIVEKRTGKRTELQSKPAVTLGASQATVQKTVAQSASKPMSFVEEMKMNRRRAKAT